MKLMFLALVLLLTAVLISGFTFNQGISFKIIENKSNERQTEMLETIVTRMLNKYELQTLVVRRNTATTGNIDILLRHVVSPRIVQGLMQTKLFFEFNKQILIIISLGHDQSDAQTALSSLAQMLTGKRETKVMLYLETRFVANRSLLLQLLFKHCYNLKMLNVIAIFSDFDQKPYFYAYNTHPKFNVEHYAFHQNKSDFFPKRFRNLYGAAIWTLPTQAAPKTILYTDRKGNQITAGYVGRFMCTLAWRLNASLKYAYSVEQNNSVNYSEMLELMKNFSLDISADTYAVVGSRDRKFLSYPHEISSICLMIPKPGPVTIETIFLLMVKRRICILILFTICIFTILLNCRDRRRNSHGIWILNDVSLRGVLGMPFHERPHRGIYFKCIYLLIFFCGIFHSTTFQADLKSLLTQPPTGKLIETFDDLYSSEIEVLISDDGKRFASEALNSPVRFKVASHLERQNAQDTMNTSFAYVMPTEKWTVILEQQEFISSYLFILSTQACFHYTLPFGFVLQSDSLYREPLEKLILDVSANGLYNFWLSHTLYDMLQAGYTSLKNINHPQTDAKALNFNNFKWIWIGYLGLIAVSFFMFAVEILKHKHNLYTK